MVSCLRAQRGALGSGGLVIPKAAHGSLINIQFMVPCAPRSPAVLFFPRLGMKDWELGAGEQLEQQGPARLSQWDHGGIGAGAALGLVGEFLQEFCSPGAARMGRAAVRMGQGKIWGAGLALGRRVCLVPGSGNEAGMGCRIPAPGEQTMPCARLWGCHRDGDGGWEQWHSEGWQGGQPLVPQPVLCPSLPCSEFVPVITG